MSEEFKRMQRLAGINEIEVNTPNSYRPLFINPKAPRAIILTDIYYIGDDAEDDFRPLRGMAVPSYKLQGYTLDDIQNAGDGMLYIERGEKGWYDEEQNMFESEDNSTTEVSKEYIKIR